MLISLKSPLTSVAWIETDSCFRLSHFLRSPLTSVAWIETFILSLIYKIFWSPLTSVAWIETSNKFLNVDMFITSPLTSVAWIETPSSVAIDIAVKGRHSLAWRGLKH